MAKPKLKSKARAPRSHNVRTEQISFRLPATVVTQLEAVAAIAGTDRSMVVRVVMGLAIHQGRQLRLGGRQQ